MKSFCRAGAKSALFLLLFVATSAEALEIPPRPTAWVTDNGNLLSPSDEQALNQKLEDFYRRSGSQILVFTFQSLEGEELFDYTMRVADQWKVKQDRAAIFLVFAQERKIRIHVGYGLEGSLTDATTKIIIQENVVPAFRKNDFAGGIGSALDRMIRVVEGKEAPIPPENVTGSPVAAEPLGAREVIFLAVLFLIFVFFVLPIMRRSGCSGCIFPFFLGGGGGGGGITYGGGGTSGGGWSVGGSWGGGGGSSFGGGGASGDW